MINDEDKRSLAWIFRRQNAVRFGDYTLASGRKTDCYVDCRRVALCSAGAAELSRAIVNTIRRLVPGQLELHKPLASVGVTGVGGQALLGAVLATAYSHGLQLDGFVDRGEEKQHGTGSRIEGNLDSTLPFFLLDDTLTTGGTVLKMLEYLREGDLHPRSALFVVDREEGGREALEQAGCRVQSLLTLTELRRLITEA